MHDKYGVRMFKRALHLPKKKSFFLFGPRNTGKSTLLEGLFTPDFSLWFNLLNANVQEEFYINPMLLAERVAPLSSSITHIVIDEIQKVPKLLDVVQLLMKDTKKKFVMSGSSARKLKQEGVNLLAGRAFVYHLHPFTSFELQSQFDLDHALQWGLLPQIHDMESDQEKLEFLKSYAHTYLKEEIWNEHLIRKLLPFQRFLEVAAQLNGKLINFSKIARDVGVDTKTIQSYYSILEDTLIGFMLTPYHNSFRKRLLDSPKFYFFDPGIVKALSRTLTVPLSPRTSAYGDAFEHFIILEIRKLIDYFPTEYRLSFLMTQSGNEIDLIIERPGKYLLCIEIKSSDCIQRDDLHGYLQLTRDIPNSEAIVLSRDPYLKQFDHVIAYPWQQGIGKIFSSFYKDDIPTSEMRSV